jgi:hypothetical protein
MKTKVRLRYGSRRYQAKSESKRHPNCGLRGIDKAVRSKTSASSPIRDH